MSIFDFNKTRIKDALGNILPRRKNLVFKNFDAADKPEDDATELTQPATSGISVDTTTISVTANGTLGVGPLANADLDGAANVILTSSTPNLQLYGVALGDPSGVYPDKTYTNGNPIGGHNIVITNESTLVTGGAQNRWRLRSEEGSLYVLTPGQTVHAPYHYGTINRNVKTADAEALVDGVVTTSLATTPGRRDGERRQTSGYSARGDGGGCAWVFAAGVSASPDASRINCSNGQWQLQSHIELGYTDPRWFGAQPTLTAAAVVDCQAAIEAAIAIAVALGLRMVRLAAGFYGVRALSTATAIVIPPSITFYCAKLGAATIVPMTQATGGTEKEVLKLSGANIRLENISVYRKDSTHYTDPRAPLALNQQLHGIRIAGFNVTLRNCFVIGMSGAGFVDNVITANASFQIQCENCHSSNNGNHGWFVTGSNTWKFDSCSAEAVPNGHAGWCINEGQFVAIACNGLFTNYHYPGLPGGWREEDTRVWQSGASQATLIGCNLEEFTSYGYLNSATTPPDLIGCVMFTVKGGVPTTPGGADGRVRAVYSTFIDRPKRLGSGTKLFAPHIGTWGDPESHVNDGCPFETVTGSLPYMFDGDDHGPTKLTSSGAIENAGKLSYVQPLGPKQVIKHPNIQLGNYFFQTALVSSNGPATPGLTVVDTTAGAVALTLTDIANAPIGFEYHVAHIKGANNVVVSDSGGGKFIDAAGSIATSFTINGIGKTVTFRIQTIWDTTLGEPAYVNGWVIASKNY